MPKELPLVAFRLAPGSMNRRVRRSALGPVAARSHPGFERYDNWPTSFILSNLPPVDAAGPHWTEAVRTWS